jgi:drug/metabolite transporter (DMT)-like permease
MGYLVASALLWSVGGVLIKWVEWHPLAIAGVRSAIAAATLWAVLRRPRFDWSAAQIGGAVAYAATVLLYVSAVKLTTAANAILLQYTAPIYVALFGAWFLGERTTWLDWLAIACSLGGMALFFRDGPFSIHSLDADGGAQAPPACCMLWYLASGGWLCYSGGDAWRTDPSRRRVREPRRPRHCSPSYRPAWRSSIRA